METNKEIIKQIDIEMKIFNEYQGDKIQLKNRIVMAPMTRTRAINNVPNELMKEYYSQRAGSGLIITEGTSPSANGLGYPRIPGAYSDEQVNGWANIAESVHKEGGKIFVQLMHTGRVSAKANLPEGAETIAPSAIQLEGEMFTETGMVPHDSPRAMELEDIVKVQEDFVNSAIKLTDNGIDGVELHAANGYLMNQFLNPQSNHRLDVYGGSIKNRARFIIETAKQVAYAVGSEKVGIRLSPYGAYNGMLSDYEELTETFTYLASELKKLNIAYIHIVDQRVAFGAPEFKVDIKRIIKETFEGTVIVGGDINEADKAEALIDEGFDLVYIGRPFIANPDLMDKLKTGAELTQPNFDLFYSAGAEGYTDYK